jgi:hypothetical protein
MYHVVTLRLYTRLVDNNTTFASVEATPSQNAWLNPQGAILKLKQSPSWRQVYLCGYAPFEHRVPQPGSCCRTRCDLAPINHHNAVAMLQNKSSEDANQDALLFSTRWVVRLRMRTGLGTRTQLSRMESARY